MPRPEATAGLRHVALQVHNLEACERFYTELLGMRSEWRPDMDNVYLTSGNDNLALHRVAGEFAATAAFLASPRASYVTGQMIRIDGGATKSL